MSFLNKLLKKTKPQQRQQKSMNNLQGADNAKLYDIASSANDATLREQAIANMAFGDELLNLAGGKYSSKITSLARQQIGVLMEKTPLLLEELIHRQDLKKNEIINIVCYSASATDSVFAMISDEQVLTDIALNGATSAVRQRAAEASQERGQLERILAGSKSKDKNVAKIARNKLSAFKLADERLANAQLQVQQVCSALENLIKRPVDDYFKQRFSELQNEWRALDSKASNGFEERLSRATQQCEQLIEQYEERQQMNAQLAREKQQMQREAQLAAKQLQDFVVEQLQQEQPDQKKIRDLLGDCQTLLNLLDQQHPSLKQEIRTLTKLHDGLQALEQQAASLPQLIHQLDAKDTDNIDSVIVAIERLLTMAAQITDKELPLASRARQRIDALHTQQRTKSERVKDGVKKVNDLLRKANGAVQAGRIRQAQGVYRELEQKRQQLKDLPAGILRRREELDNSMQKIGDWHEFAVSPKKLAVVEQMEALKDSELHPVDLSERIKTLQEEWKSLCKGAKSDDAELWQRLKSAADVAFQPCREYFDQQAQQRAQNAQQREVIIRQLQQYIESYHWGTLVWKDVEQTLSVARDTWKHYWPVPRNQIKPLQKTFDELLDTIYEKLRTARKANLAEKTRIIELAEAQLTAENLAGATDEIKRLQAQWKALGGTDRRGRADEQKLWHQFRSACDEIFARRDQENHAMRQQYDAEVKKAEQLLREFDTLLCLEKQDLLEARKRTSELEQQLSALDLPEQEQRKIQRELRIKVDKLQTKTDAERSKIKRDTWQEIYEIAAAMCALEQDSLQGHTNAVAVNAVKQTLEEQHQWPDDAKNIIQQRLNNIENNCVASNGDERTLRLLCIQKEIYFGLQTPEEDKALRMSYQVEQLTRDFGKAEKPANLDESLALQWLSVVGVNKLVYDKLFSRFNQEAFEKAALADQ